MAGSTGCGWCRARCDGRVPIGDSRTKLCHAAGETPGRIILAISRMVAEDYQHYHGTPPERIRLIYNGVDTERYSPERSAEYREANHFRVAFIMQGIDNRFA